MYFKTLPTLRYPSFLSDKNSSLDYVDAKNLFRRVKLREDLQNILTLFDKYEIPEGFRPENVAEELYGNDKLDWVVIVSSGIVNIRNEWPLSNNDLYEYSLLKYGNNLNATHHFETVEVKDSSGRIVLKKGKVVNQDFKLFYQDGGEVKTNDLTKLGTNVVAINDPVASVSNYLYETFENEKKRNIYVLKRGFLQQFIDDFKDVMTYEPSSQRVSDNIVQTENLNVTMP
jgi:hypothetical protein|tara:strand:+ start:459 stop:1145 length:687 start_codon:yes stop_codon:yes gene_type:complete